MSDPKRREKEKSEERKQRLWSFKPPGKSLQLDEEGLKTTEGGETTGAAHLCVYTYGIRSSNQQLEYKAPVCGGHDFY